MVLCFWCIDCDGFFEGFATSWMLFSLPFSYSLWPCGLLLGGRPFDFGVVLFRNATELLFLRKSI
jgi:hypothetical protein